MMNLYTNDEWYDIVHKHGQSFGEIAEALNRRYNSDNLTILTKKQCEQVADIIVHLPGFVQDPLNDYDDDYDDDDIQPMIVDHLDSVNKDALSMIIIRVLSGNANKPIRWDVIEWRK